MGKILLPGLNKEITMREPKVKDMRISSASSPQEDMQEINLLANLTGMTPDEIDDLTMKDYGVLQEELKSFLS